ncbi:bromodomain adjacent to zinc finger domain protein 2B-like [Leguminivora glycinivorella]|uniref:bromodomain adjacent to zinc finger domain protein 2B-like n=1 Tax=Leguminivora glycinivorella TaxID=1035111 RepID=UPI0020104A2E|nr:bromodomain adjacent to zinc finger domain protein 2B-like [Leguminivora glycinivorella]
MFEKIQLHYNLGLSAERERERRVADHHQTDAEIQQTVSTTKNGAYYEHLHNNNTYKLSEALRDKPFLALNATTKSAILAFLCNELLQNKSVLRQIDGALDHLNQLKKERYLMDMKIRKVRVLHQRKQRAEQAEKQQLLALERMQRLVEESTANLSRASPQSHEDEHATPEKDRKEDDKESTPDIPPSPYKEESDLSPLKDKKELMNNNKEECSPQDNKVDKDSVMGDCDAILSDLESEGTQPEEDEDKNLSAEELSRKLEKLLRQSEQQLQQLAAGSHALRCGGVFVEAMESAQPEIMDYHFVLEERALRPATTVPRRVIKEGKEIQAAVPDLATEALKKKKL